MNARRLTVLALLIVVSTLSYHTNGHAAGSTFNGQIQVPVLTLHTKGDGPVPVQNEQAYASDDG